MEGVDWVGRYEGDPVRCSGNNEPLNDRSGTISGRVIDFDAAALVRHLIARDHSAAHPVSTLWWRRDGLIKGVHLIVASYLTYLIRQVWVDLLSDDRRSSPVFVRAQTLEVDMRISTRTSIRSSRDMVLNMRVSHVCMLAYTPASTSGCTGTPPDTH